MTAPAVPVPAPPAIPPTPPVDALTTRLIAQHGTVEHALRALVTASITTEQQIATVTRERDDLRAKLPEGAVVLTKEAAANWQKLQDLKLTPDQIADAVKKLPEVEGRLTRHDREKEYRAVATAAGVDPDAFVEHAFRVNLATELRDITVTENGKQLVKKVPFVKVATDEKAQPAPFTGYMANLQPFEQRALKATTAAPVGVPAHSQHSTATVSSTGDKTADFIAERNQRAAGRPNPFAPPRQPAGAAS